MPKVGDKTFPYTEEGMRMAEEYSQMTGLPIEYEGEGGPSDSVSYTHLTLQTIYSV